jgi:hypothetical protein
MHLRVVARVDNMAVPGLRRVFIPLFHHPQFSPWTKRRQPPARPCGGLTSRRLSTALQMAFCTWSTTQCQARFSVAGLQILLFYCGLHLALL